MVQTQVAVGYDQYDELLSRNFSFSEGKKRLVAPEELGYMKDESILITPKGPCRIEKAFCYDDDFYNRLAYPHLYPWAFQ